MLSRETPRHAAPGAAPSYPGSERGTGRRPRDQRGAERADAKNGNLDEGRSRRGDARHAAPGYSAPSSGAVGRGGSGRRGSGAAYRGRAVGDAGADTGYGAAEASYRGPDAGRHHRDTIRLDTYRPPHDWDLDDGGDTDYDEDPDDDADEDLDAEYDADAEEYAAEPDDDADAGYDEEAAFEAGAGYGAHAAYEQDDDYDERYLGADSRHRRGGGGYRGAAVYHAEGPPGYGAGLAGADADEYGAAAGSQDPGERTEVLINHGRRHAPPKGIRRWLRHWRAIGIGIVGVVAGAVAITLIVPGSDATWPSSVALVQKEIDVACENPNVVSEPSQVNFACGKDTRQILWVFSLLTSGDNPDYSDAANGRKGLEPITPAQGGDIAWSLNLHHPYDPANPADSLAVAARAINNIIGGASLTGSNGSAVVQPGLESTAANCTRYTGSSALVTRQGFPAVCAQPVTSTAGQAALVSDVFRQWMVGSPAQVATEAGVLFENADNPGDPRVQAILNTLPQTGL
jgi:hypothetical protein